MAITTRTGTTSSHGHGVRCVALLTTLLVGGCELGPSDLAAYSRTAAGPAKIRAVIEGSQYADDLRADAVVILFDLDRDDVDGEGLAMGTLKRLPEGTRQGILKALLQRLGPRISADSAASEAAQIRAKDALTELTPLAAGEVRQRYGKLLIEWYARALTDRAQSGRHSLSGLVDALGELAAPPLTEALHARLPATELSELASLLASVARGPARTTAGTKLIEIETRWRSDGRLALLEAELRDAMASGQGKPEASGSKPPKSPSPAAAKAKSAPLAAEAAPPDWLREQADAQRHREIETALLPAMGRFADTQVVTKRLLTLATGTDEAIPDAQRELALQLLRDHTTPEQVGELLTLAADRERPVRLRELALACASEHAGNRAMPQLLAIMSTRRHRALRQRAAELVLEIGGGGALGAFFRAMPKAWTMDFSRAELEAYAQRMAAIDPDAPTLNFLGTKLHSPYWWARVLGLRYFAQRAKWEDLWRIRQHVHDYLLVRGSGFPQGYTIGQEAQAALAVALKRIRGLHNEDTNQPPG